MARHSSRFHPRVSQGDSILNSGVHSPLAVCRGRDSTRSTVIQQETQTSAAPAVSTRLGRWGRLMTPSSDYDVDCPPVRGPLEGEAPLPSEMKKVPEFLAVVYCPLPSMRSIFHSPSYSCPFHGPSPQQKRPRPCFLSCLNCPSYESPFASVRTPDPSFRLLLQVPTYLEPSGHVKVPSPSLISCQNVTAETT